MELKTGKIFKMKLEQAEEIADAIEALIEAIISDDKACSCCRVPQSYEAKGQLVRTLAPEEYDDEGSV